MNIGKKAVLLTAAAGALVIGGAGGALANSNDDSVSQRNKCDTSSGIMISGSGSLAPTGDTAIGSDCINFTNAGGSVDQSNDCDTTTATTLSGNANLAPRATSQSAAIAPTSLSTTTAPATESLNISQCSRARGNTAGLPRWDLRPWKLPFQGRCHMKGLATAFDFVRRMGTPAADFGASAHRHRWPDVR
ncbi:hypothetical protein SSPO_048120 [Streptomyces antimycoticus]|uniref:Secreted protein n=1 Tax=Streptomyces antimycoticus TaxID=68175 RepID=A0A499UK25_9ACTN|nr:hypothetical protein [Streptomyces antimycoticus]BBJ42094.1 hypothetical protein SSPO_048120 [Streptomyces antimycoticus]